MLAALQEAGLDRCYWCNVLVNYATSHEKKSASVDHLVPISSGGQTTKGNCVLSCSRCNGLKGCNEKPFWPVYHYRRLIEFGYRQTGSTDPLAIMKRIREVTDECGLGAIITILSMPETRKSVMSRERVAPDVPPRPVVNLKHGYRAACEQSQ